MRSDGRTRGRIAGGLLLALVICWQVSHAFHFAAAAENAPSDVAEEVTRLIGELDHPQFATRRKAAERLDRLADDPRLGSYLAGCFRRVLASNETSFEVRSHLEPLVRRLPRPAIDENAPPDAAEIAGLLDRLSSDVYLERESATRTLKAMLAHEALIGPLWAELKRRAANPALSASGQRALAPLLDQAREAWLLADPSKIQLPIPTDQEVAQYLDTLVRLDEVLPANRLPYQRAQRELLDLIARDETRERVLAMVRDRLAATDEAGRSPLMELIDFAQPGLAAEVWLNHTHMTVQYLIVGMPQLNDTLTVPKATLFDRIDDQVAHCVSGNSLKPGDYPVRVAIPHPEPGTETIFFLTNLPTPRRRLAYEYYLRRSEQQRLESMTTRTVEFFLKGQTPLTENEILMLAQLDPRVVSRFAGSYFETVKNSELIPTQNVLGGQTTVFGAICAVLSRVGTHEAVPALERLAKSGALGGPSFESRLDIAWVAALAIAQRDPWPEMDEWLASLLDSRMPLTSDPDRPPEVGASAAGLLLDRRGASTRPFGLETAGEAVTESFRFVGYRFSGERDRADVKRWWQKQQALAAAGRESGLSGARAPGKGPAFPAVRKPLSNDR